MPKFERGPETPRDEKVRRGLARMQALCAELKELGDAESVGDGFTLRLTECTEEIGNALTFWHTNF